MPLTEDQHPVGDRWNVIDTWVWSTDQAHPAIIDIDIDTFAQAQTCRTARRVTPPDEWERRHDASRRPRTRGVSPVGAGGA
ncbi:hypothetical protein [Parafrankia sp. FMc2]|uniref:hypothetical protein n=1 Tax=Parafrankia sp. FMc2 TaxID=3233196 RepID=UPI0034D51F54